VNGRRSRTAVALPAVALLLAARAVLAPPGAGALSLEEAKHLLLERAPALEAEGALLRRAEAVLTEARASRGPELRFKAAAGLLADPPEGITVRAGELGEIPLPPPVPIPAEDLVFVENARHTHLEFSAELLQPVYTWGKLRYGEQLAAGEARAQRLRLQQRQRDLLEELAGLYFGALSARQSVPLLEETVSVLEELAADRRRAVELGESTRLAVLELEGRLARARGQLLRTKEAEATAREALGLLLDLPPEEIELTSGFGAALTHTDEAALWRQALAVSPRLDLARQELELAQTGVALRRAGATLRPDVRLSLELSVSGQALPWTEPQWSDTWDWDLVLGVGTEGALLDSGRARARIGQAEQTSAAASAALEAATRQLRLALRQAVQELRVRQAELAERAAALAEAQEAERAAQAAYREQAGTREQWGLARLQLLLRRLELLGTRVALEQAQAALDHLTAP
jgi:outer membrane protein TolC